MTSSGRPEVDDSRPAPWAGDHCVAVCRSASGKYPAPPFHPPEAFPELAQLEPQEKLDPENHVYRTVRESFRQLGLDAANYGTPHWNPLGQIVRPGDRVLIKPNWVAEKHDLDGTFEQIITHGAVIRPVIDYVAIALAGQGTISLADGPMLGSNFDLICQRTGIYPMRDYLTSLGTRPQLELLDLRSQLLVIQDEVVLDRKQLPGDPLGGVAINLGRNSAFYGFQGEGRYYGADYDTDEVNKHHHGETQEYQLSGTAMHANVVIDVPKLKTHHKVGVTLALKGVVGLNCGRNWLPHRTMGVPAQGGDQFAESGWRQRLEFVVVRALEKASLVAPNLVPKAFRVAKRVGKRILGKSHETVRGGGWWGNETLWRTVLDINRSLMFADPQGAVQPRPARRRMTIIDGIVAGEGVGPVFADAVPAGVILTGTDATVTDTIGAELMGFDYAKIPHLVEAFAKHPLPLTECQPEEIQIHSNVPEWNGSLENLREVDPFVFKTPLGWIGHMERPREQAVLAEATAGD